MKKAQCQDQHKKSAPRYRTRTATLGPVIHCVAAIEFGDSARRRLNCLIQIVSDDRDRPIAVPPTCYKPCGGGHKFAPSRVAGGGFATALFFFSGIRV